MIRLTSAIVQTQETAHLLKSTLALEASSTSVVHCQVEDFRNRGLPVMYGVGKKVKYSYTDLCKIFSPFLQTLGVTKALRDQVLEEANIAISMATSNDVSGAPSPGATTSSGCSSSSGQQQLNYTPLASFSGSSSNASDSICGSRTIPESLSNTGR